jgi:peptide/nickel transport system ATP-binding protein
MPFITQDLAVVNHASDRVAMIYLGKLCEIGSPDALFNRPADPYTGDLRLCSIPKTPHGLGKSWERDAVTDSACQWMPLPPTLPSGNRGVAPEQEPRIRSDQGDRDQHVACQFQLPRGHFKGRERCRRRVMTAN